MSIVKVTQHLFEILQHNTTTRKHARTRTQTCRRARTYVRSRARAHTHTYTHTHTHTCARARVYAHISTHARAHTSTRDRMMSLQYRLPNQYTTSVKVEERKKERKKDMIKQTKKHKETNRFRQADRQAFSERAGKQKHGRKAKWRMSADARFKSCRRRPCRVEVPSCLTWATRLDVVKEFKL